MKHLVRLTFILGSLLVATACGGKSSGATPKDGPTCDDAAAGMMAAAPEMEAAATADDTAAIAGVCTSDGWTPEEIACFATKHGDELQACGDMLTPEQVESLGTQMAAKTGKMEGQGSGRDDMGDGMTDEGMDDDAMEGDSDEGGE